MVRAAGARSFLELRSRVVNRLKLHDHRFCRRPRGSDISATEAVLLPTFPQHISCNTGETSPHPEARGAREFNIQSAGTPNYMMLVKCFLPWQLSGE
jgi:hypothetical protein